MTPRTSPTATAQPVTAPAAGVGRLITVVGAYGAGCGGGSAGAADRMALPPGVAGVGGVGACGASGGGAGGGGGGGGGCDMLAARERLRFCRCSVGCSRPPRARWDGVLLRLLNTPVPLAPQPPWDAARAPQLVGAMRAPAALLLALAAGWTRGADSAALEPIPAFFGSSVCTGAPGTPGDTVLCRGGVLSGSQRLSTTTGAVCGPSNTYRTDKGCPAPFWVKCVPPNRVRAAYCSVLARVARRAGRMHRRHALRARCRQPCEPAALTDMSSALAAAW